MIHPSLFGGLLLAGAGGMLGSMARYLIACVAMAAPASGFPVGTLAVNAAGSLLIGVAMGALPPGGWYLFAAVGFCGGFTTFSAFSAETLRMLREGQWGMALLYVAASLALCLAAAGAGAWIGRKCACMFGDL